MRGRDASPASLRYGQSKRKGTLPLPLHLGFQSTYLMSSQADSQGNPSRSPSFVAPPASAVGLAFRSTDPYPLPGHPKTSHPIPVLAWLEQPWVFNYPITKLP